MELIVKGRLQRSSNDRFFLLTDIETRTFNGSKFKKGKLKMIGGKSHSLINEELEYSFFSSDQKDLHFKKLKGREITFTFPQGSEETASKFSKMNLFRVTISETFVKL